MKGIGLFVGCLLYQAALSQVLQLHYDPRHALDAKRNGRNFCTLYFEFFKEQDSGRHLVKPGSFLLKMQTDFTEPKNNPGQFFMQVAQTLRLWKPKVFLNLEYKGGLGLTQPREYSYYIPNTYSIGLRYPFRWGNAYLSGVINYKYVSYDRGSHDPLFTLYWWRGVRNDRAELAGHFSLWTENKNHGDASTNTLGGKRLYVFAEPQFWYNLNSVFGVGTKVNTYYHVLTYANGFQVYPTIAVRCKL